jgi:ribosome-binding factor A
MSLRQQRVSELLKRELGEIIRREFSINETGLLNVNEVLMSSDLHSATVLIGVVGTKDQKKKAATVLDTERKRIQGLLGRSVILKYTPALRFLLDESIEQGNRVLEIIDELDKSSPAE